MITNLIQYLNRQVSETPDKVVVSDEKNSFTFRELNEYACLIASEIVNTKQDYFNKPVVVFCEKNIYEYGCLIGVLYSGNCYVPLDIKMPSDRLKKILDNLKPKIVLTSGSLINKLSECGYQEKLILIEKLGERGAITPNLKYDMYRKIIDVDPAYILFTSGSTGNPKGVVVSHRAVIDYIEWQKQYLGFSGEDVLANQAPFYFDASMPDIFTPLATGASLCIIPDKLFLNASKLIGFLRENKVTTLIWVPSALMVLSKSGALCNEKIEQLKRVLFCGEVMPNKHLNIWRKEYENVEFINLYGPTEAAYACTYYIVNREFSDNDSLPIGVPCENTAILLLDEDGKEVNEGIGEICVRGSCLANGYLNDEAKTKQAFSSNPNNESYNDMIYHTGDLAHYNSYGELEYVGRKDFQIKHMGYRIELGEIEAAAYSIDAVQRACALYDSDNAIIKLCCEGNTVSDKEVYKQLKTKLPSYMLPKKIYIIEEMPLNANGKVDRKKISEMVK